MDEKGHAINGKCKRDEDHLWIKVLLRSKQNAKISF